MNNKKAYAILFLCGIVMPSLSSGTEDEDVFSMSLDDLLTKYQTVVSGSRTSQLASESSVPITVITSEDIHFSGLTSIPEILQFYLGVDVMRLDRNRYAVGVRGFHDYVSERTLTLINGRAANSPVFGGSEYYRYPVLIQDIDRIEIVRGPGGAAWGANAFTGIINIITKIPSESNGLATSVTASEWGDMYSYVRMAQERNKWHWRSSLGYENKKSSDQAGSGDYMTTNPALSALIGFNGFKADDFSRDFRTDNEFTYQHSDNTQLSFGFGYSHDELGTFEMIGYYPEADTFYETFRPYGKIEHTYSDTLNGYLQWFCNTSKSEAPSHTAYDSIQNDIELQINKTLSVNRTLSVGGNVRYERIKASALSDQSVMLSKNPYDEDQFGLFAIDRWHLTSRLTWEGQVRLDHDSSSKTDWSARATALYALDDTRKHSLRLSLARAFRVPLGAIRYANIGRIPLPPGLGGGYAVNFVQPGKLDNEETWSIEGGYSSQIDDTLILYTNVYYQRYKDMIGYAYTNVVGPVITATALQMGGVDTYGSEIQIEKTIQDAKLTAWYAYSDTMLDNDAQSIRSYGPAKHKVGIAGRMYFKDMWTVNCNYRYSDTVEEHMVGSMVNSSVDHRCDVTISRKICDEKGEMMVGVTDVFNETNGPNLGMGSFTGHETPGRMFFARMQYPH